MNQEKVHHNAKPDTQKEQLIVSLRAQNDKESEDRAYYISRLLR